MKKNIHLPGVFSLLIAISTGLHFYSCDNSFLEENYVPEYTELNDTIFVASTSAPFSLDFDFGKNEACNWRLAQFPYWLEVSPKEGFKKSNETSEIQLVVKRDNIIVEPGFFTFPLVFETDGEKLVEYTVALANFGYPDIQVSSSMLSFSNSFSNAIEISNNSYGILNWWIADAPDWLKWDKEYGLIYQHQSESVQFTADINGMAPGDYSETLTIRSNAVNQQEVKIQVTLQVGASAYYGKYQRGQFIDAKYSKKRDEVIVLTKSPNQLLFFSSDVSNPKIVTLDGVPQCLALTEDESTIAVGFSNSEVTTFNAQNYGSINTYDLGNIPLSVEFANNNWLYFIATHGYGNYLHSYNLNTNQLSREKGGRSGMLTLKKVPGKPLLFSTRPGYTPDGLVIFDISETGQTDSINQYHMSMYGFWLSDDGERFFTGWKKIYNIPDFNNNNSFIPNDPPAAGQLEFEEHQIIDCISSQSSSERIFAASGFHGSGNNVLLKMYHSRTLVQEKSFELKFVRPDFFSVYSTWYGTTKALFPSKNQKELWTVQQFAQHDSEGQGIWSVSKVDITK